MPEYIVDVQPVIAKKSLDEQLEDAQMPKVCIIGEGEDTKNQVQFGWEDHDFGLCIQIKYTI